MLMLLIEDDGMVARLTDMPYLAPIQAGSWDAHELAMAIESLTPPRMGEAEVRATLRRLRGHSRVRVRRVLASEGRLPWRAR